MNRSVKFIVLMLVSTLTLSGAWAQSSSDALPGILTAPPAPTVTAPPPVASISAGDASIRYKAALDLVKQNQLQEAETALVDIARDFPLLSGPQTQLGLLYLRSKRAQPAAQAFQRAVQANPQNAVAYNGLGMALRESRDYARSEQAYLRALTLNPNYGAANLNLGILYDAYLNRPQSALPYYRRYLQNGGQDDLRVSVWIAQIEKAPTATTPPGKR